MLGNVRSRRPSAAMVVAFLALCVALSGTAVGESAVTSAQELITGKQIKNRSVTGVDIKSNSLTSGAIKNQSLRRADFKLGELPAGPAGAKGDVGAQGPQGPKGDTGTVDTSNFYDKAASDGRFLGATAKAADADKLDGRDASGFGQVLDSGTKTTTLTPLAAGACTNDGPITTAPEGKLVIPFGANFTNNRLVAIPDSTVQTAGGQVAAFWKVCNVSNDPLDPGEVTTQFVILGP